MSAYSWEMVDIRSASASTPIEPYVGYFEERLGRWQHRPDATGRWYLWFTTEHRMDPIGEAGARVDHR